MFAFFFLLLSHAQQQEVNHCDTFKNGWGRGCGSYILYFTAPIATILGRHHRLYSWLHCKNELAVPIAITLDHKQLYIIGGGHCRSQSCRGVPQWCAETPSVWGGGILTNWPTIVIKKNGTENTIANSLAAWLTFEKLSCKC